MKTLNLNQFRLHESRQRIGGAINESPRMRRFLIGTAVIFLGLFLLVPLLLIFVYAFSKGFSVFIGSFTDPEAFSAIRLTVITASIVVPLNTLFGLIAAWAIAKFDFKGKSLLITLLDLPFAISPVIAGLMFMLLFGAQGLFGAFLQKINVQIMFATPGIIIATLFVTFPFVARELIPLMQAQGNEEETAALTLGAGGWQIFRRITLPNIRWGLIYGIILCNARAMGEFGAVSVVSGHIRGFTNTIPLHIEILYNDYQFSSAFAVASLLTLLAILTLVVKCLVEWKTAREIRIATENAGMEYPK